jgi:hypothetical protein
MKVLSGQIVCRQAKVWGSKLPKLIRFCHRQCRPFLTRKNPKRDHWCKRGESSHCPHSSHREYQFAADCINDRFDGPHRSMLDGG